MAGQNPGSTAEFQYFYEDEVFKINKRGQVVFGLVMENFEANSSEEDTEEETPVKKGEIRVVWHPSGIERVISPAVGLADRSLMPGDVVRRMIKGKDTQRGYCRDIIVSAAVQVVGTNLVLPAVPSERLQPLEEFTTDLAVCLDSWVGTSKIVNSKMRLVSADGSRIEFPDVNNCLLEDYLQRRRRGGRSPGVGGYLNTPDYYPGQVVTGPLGMLDEAMWLHTTKEMKAAKKHKMREQKFTVESVDTESVGVQWQCRALGSGPPQQPRFLVEGEELSRLKLLNLFEPCTLQLGARNFLTVTETDNFSTKGHWKKTQSKLYRALRRQTRPARSRDTKEATAKDAAANTHTQDSNSTNKLSFRISCKYKKRLSIHNRDAKTVFVHNNATHPAPHETKTHSSKDDTKKDDKTCTAKSGVDIVIVNGESEEPDLANGGKPDQAPDNTDGQSKPSISPQPQKDVSSRLDVPEATLNGRKSSSPDRSSTPDISGSPEKRKKLRKAKLSPSNNSSGDPLNLVIADHKGPRTDLDDSDNWDNTSSDEGTNTDSCCTWSSHCSSSPNNSWRGRRLPQLVTKFLKGKRLKRSSQREPSGPKPKPGDRLVVETLTTASKANVVWQDGTIELGIPSIELYPIHHLDGQECFPGDFVVSGSGSPSLRDYGVVQKVDHHGRTAVVKWFRTYTSCQEPVPQLVSENEVSVYDLKDHPDFQYRPGTVVIRVANFTGPEATCTAGQVIDNFPSGRVNVWWVDGHTSMCWPQDLYKVGEYDSDEGDLWAEDGTGSEDSWETQYSGGSGGVRSRERDVVEGYEGAIDLTINSPGGPDFPKVPRCLEPRAAVHIERGRAAMAKLEEMFSKNPALQNQEIMRKLLNLYKDCRFLDRLLGTSFFHEDHFQGLLERVRERGGTRGEVGGSGGSRRVHNQVLRLFSHDESDVQSALIESPTKSDAIESSSPVSNTVSTPVTNPVSTPVTNPYSTPTFNPLIDSHYINTLSDTLCTLLRNPVSINVSTDNSNSLTSPISNSVNTSISTPVSVANRNPVSPPENSSISNSASTPVSKPVTNPADTSVSTHVKIKPLPEQEKENVMYRTILSPQSYQTEQANLAAVGDHFVKVFWSVQVVNNGVGAVTNDSVNSISHASALNNENPIVDIDLNVVRNYCNLKNLTAELNGSLKEPFSDTRLQSSSSEGSLCKYLTPVGSVSDLTAQPGDKSPVPPGVCKTGPNQDSGIDSSISQSANNTVSSNGDLENTFLSSDLILEDSANTESSTLKVSQQTPVTSSPEAPLSTRNVCQKLCSLINIQMMKACTEISSRRSLLFMEFLNKVLYQKAHASREVPLPYHFSMQYDALVVTMRDDKEIAPETEKNPDEENAEWVETEILPPKVEENKPKDSQKLKENKEKPENNEIQGNTEKIEIKENQENKETGVTENPPKEKDIPGSNTETSPECSTVLSDPSSSSAELGEGFCVLETAPTVHHFRLSLLQPSEPRVFQQAVRRELKLLKSHLPQGVWVRGYEDRMDLLSIMIAGPAKTPYEGGLFMFDVQLGGEYPRAPPMCHYISYCSDRLNPNLYEDGKVCVSLLGTWSGRGVEVWGKESSLIQVIVSLQGLILCAEPYFNEAGYEKQKGSQQGSENSRMYNEMVLLKLVQSLTKMLGNIPEVFREEILSFQAQHSADLCNRLQRWMAMSEQYTKLHPNSPLTPESFFASMGPLDPPPPDYPLIPVSRGFCLSLNSSLEAYRNALKQVSIPPKPL